MTRGKNFLLICLLLTQAGFQTQTFSQSATKPKSKTARVLIQTELGEIEIEIETERAPGATENFLKYVWPRGQRHGGREEDSPVAGRSATTDASDQNFQHSPPVSS